MRIRALSLLLALLAVPCAASAEPVHLTSAPSVAPAVHLVTAREPAPVKRDRLPLAPLMAFAVAGATKAKRSSRRSSGKAADIPMYLDSDVHVWRDGETVTVKGGVLLDDTDLEEDEIESISKHGVIRPATPAEIARLAVADANAERAELVATQDAELAQLRARHAAETQSALEGGKPEEAKAKLAEKQAVELTKMQESHAAALNRLSQ